MLLAHVRIANPPRPWMEAYEQMRTCLELWVASLPTADEQERAAARLQELITPSFFTAIMSRLHINSFRWVPRRLRMLRRCVAHLVQHCMIKSCHELNMQSKPAGWTPSFRSSQAAPWQPWQRR